MKTDRQVRRLMEEFIKTGEVEVSAERADMHRNTGRRYLREGKLPSERKRVRTWRTREDPFEEHWEEVERWLLLEPGLEAKTVFEELCERYPGCYEEGQLRTLQRRVRGWRASNGPEKEVFFAQEHRPGEAFQTDFTDCGELFVTLRGEAFEHLLCHVMLPYSNWEWVVVVHSESLLALKKGLQGALFVLGRVPFYHQTDNSTSATHRLKTGARGYNEEYVELLKHFGMKPRRIEVAASEQNGDVEVSHRVFKRRVLQALMRRGSRDFESEQVYEEFVQEVARKANSGRVERLQDELAVMRELKSARLPEFKEEWVTVGSTSTIRVRYNTYSVPSRLIGEELRVRVFEGALEVYHGTRLEMNIERLRGRFNATIDYRHIIHSLVKKPGAFARYRHREALFPQAVFRQAYDALRAGRSERSADLEYLRLLYLSATTMETEVASALSLLLEAGMVPTLERVRELMPEYKPEVTALSLEPLKLQDYDELLTGGMKHGKRPGRQSAPGAAARASVADIRGVL